MNEGQFLEHVARLARELKQPPNTPKRRMPKVSRMQSPRMRVVSKGTINGVRAIYQTTEQAGRHTITGEPEGITTREVGPGDEYNRYGKYGESTTKR
jgi:hypothetical protein